MKCCDCCQSQIDDHVDNCPQCGGSQRPIAASGAAQQIRGLIGEANVHRIRREFDEAVEKCTQALELDSNNADVNSLLGDIYSQRGELAEAARWYELAIDLRPDSVIDANKLDQLKARIARNGAGSAGVEAKPGSTSALANDRTLRYFIFGCAIAVVLLLAAGLRIWESSIQPDMSYTAPVVGSRPSKLPPADSATTMAPPDVSVRPSAEQQMLYRLATSPETASRHLIVEDVRIDPRRHQAAITFWNSRDTTTPLRATVLEEAAAVAQAAFKSDPTLKTVTSRAIVQINGKSRLPEPHLALVCDFQRSIAAGTPTTLHPVAGAVYWDPQIPNRAQ